MGVGTRYMGRINQPLTNEAAKKLMALDVQDKEILTYEKLDEWYTAWGGQCYVSFSGGKDSTVLAYLAARYLSSFRTPPWELNLVFVNTGLEYPEIQKFVNEYADWLRREFPRVTVNLHRLRPKMNIREVVTKYGYSIVSKEVADCITDAKRNPNSLRMKRLRGEAVRNDGKPSAYNCEKWEFLLYAPFNISAKCCAIMKKSPLKTYAHKTGYQATTATMAEESRLRMTHWLNTGCNAFEGKRPMGKPMSFWTEQDVLQFKCYIYRTKGTVPHIINDKWVQMEVGGTVIGEFTCDRIDRLTPANEPYGIYDIDDDYVLQTCLENGTLWDYGHGTPLYGWHISDLKIYDPLKELSEFKGLCKVESDCCACPYYNYSKMDCDGRTIKRPFQSWGYVEEQK